MSTKKFNNVLIFWMTTTLIQMAFEFILVPLSCWHLKHVLGLTWCLPALSPSGLRHPWTPGQEQGQLRKWQADPFPRAIHHSRGYKKKPPTPQGTKKTPLQPTFWQLRLPGR